MRPIFRKLSFRFAACAIAIISPHGVFPEEHCDSRVEMRGGVPTFFVNGRPHSGVCYSSYDCDPANLARRVRHFADAGCDIFNFVVEVSGYGFSRPMWVAREEWDFSELDQRAGTILAATTNGKLMPRIYIDAPAWWRAENPDEMMVLSNGFTSFGEKLFALPRASDFPSLASKKWRADMTQALGKVMDHIEGSAYGKRVIGYQLSSQKTEEWYHWSMNTELLGDYSPHMVSAFREWLRAKYETDEKLQQAWGHLTVTLDSAKIPSQKERFGDPSRTFRDPVPDRHVIDFHIFWSEIMADTISYFAKTVKDTTSRKKTVGAFYGYTFEFAELCEDAGHLALGRLLRCPDIDFIMAPSSYYDRNLPGKPFFRAPVASLNLHGKVFWNDFDQVSFKYYEKLNEAPGLKQWEYQMGLTKTAGEFVWMNRREVGMALAQGAQIAHFDIHGGYYEDPVIMDGVRGLIEIRNQALPLDSRASIAEILVIVDEQSEHYLTFRNPITKTLLAAQLANMGFVAPYDTLLLSDLNDIDTRRYKLVLLLNALKLDLDQRQMLRQKLARGGKTVVWFHAPGYISHNRIAPENMGEVTGINVVPDPVAPRGGPARLSTPFFGEQQELTLIPGDQFRVLDPDAIPLGTRADDLRNIVMALKRFADWTSVYSAVAPLPPPVLRRLANQAGVHLYTSAPDHLVFATKNYLTLGAPTDTETCEVTLPEKRTVTDLTTGKIICRGSKVFSVSLHPKEVRIFFMD